MTLEVIRPETKEIIAPALRVALGEITWQQANTDYIGVELPCVHCWEELQRRSTAGLQIGNATLRRADVDPTLDVFSGPFGSAVIDLSDSSIVSKFRKGYRTEKRRRWMHFVHKKGFAEQFEELPCHSQSQDHRLAVMVFLKYLRGEYRKNHPHADIQVSEEKRLIIKPGEPPLTRRPDFIVEVDGTLTECVEVQRSPISLDDLKSRTEHLRSTCPKVTWYIEKRIYESVSFSDSRNWLHEEGITYYYYWINEDGQVKYSLGRLVEKRSKQNHLLQPSDLPGRGSCTRFADLIEQARGTTESFETTKQVQPDVSKPPIFVEHEQYKDEPLTDTRTQNPAAQQRPAPTQNLGHDTRTQNIAAQQRPAPTQNLGYSDFVVGDKVELYVDKETIEGYIIGFNQGMPLVEFSSRIRGRLVPRQRSPINSSDIRKLSTSQSEGPQQLSLLG